MAGLRGSTASLFTRLRPSRFSAGTETNTTGGKTTTATKSNPAANGTSIQSPQGFSPRLIFSQIIALQSLHYLCLSILIEINHWIFGTSITVDRIFTTRFIQLWSMDGWKDNGAILLSHAFGSFLLLWIVEKSRKCLDFASTLFLIHFLMSCMYDGFPSSLDWWVIHFLGTIIMTLLGEYLCSRRELEDIPLL